MKNVLLIAGFDQKYYFEAFIAASASRNINVFVFDPSRLPAETTLSVALDTAGNLSGTIDVLTYDQNEPLSAHLSIRDIDIAWYLRESSTSDRIEAMSLEERFAKNESRAALRSLFSVMECKWINQQDTVHFLSSNKLYQQLVARKCGLSIPRTLISNSPESVAAFSDPACGLLLKSIGYIWLDEERRYFLYSERFSHHELVHEPKAIKACPVFAQEYIEKRYEYRVMAIGSRVLSCRIDSQASAIAAIDWRHYDFEHVEHVQVELPEHVQGKILRLMKSLDLRYGAIDLIETPEGDFVFLEVNPSGQWGWLADLAGLPIPAAVAQMFETI